jgi:hypothetical protein
MAGRICDCLVSRYGRDSVFMDADNPLGLHDRNRLDRALRQSDVLIAIMGANWLGRDANRAKIFEEDDPVRIEIETALWRGIRIIPTLVNGAAMPDPTDLPSELRHFTFLNAIAIDEGHDFNNHMNRLIHVMDDVLGLESGPAARAPQALAPRGRGIATIATIAAAGAAGVAAAVAAPAVATTVAAGVLIVGGGAALVAGSIAAIKQIGKVANRHRTAGEASRAGTSRPAPVRDQEQDRAIDALASQWQPASKAGGRSRRQDEDDKDQDKDDVECSVFAPARPQRGRTIVVQVLLHQTEQLAAAIKLAVGRDPGANRKGFAKLSDKIKRGTRVQFFLEIPALPIETPFRETTWTGSPVRVEYAVNVPSTIRLGPCDGALHVMMYDIPIGEITFELNIEESKPRGKSKFAIAALRETDAETEDRRADPVAKEAVRFKDAFISYSRKDAQQVYLFAEALEECGIELLVDVTGIEPGEEWEPKLIELINDADVFYLMWSNNAAQSTWVENESRLAVDRYDGSDLTRLPRIRPVVIEHRAPDPPDHLKRFQFSSKWSALRMAQERSNRSPARRSG